MTDDGSNTLTSDLLRDLRSAIEKLRHTCESNRNNNHGQSASAFGRAMAELVDLASSVNGEQWSALVEIDPNLAQERSWLAAHYARYVFDHEVEAAESFFKTISKPGCFTNQSMTPWGVSAYQRVQDLFDHVDLSACRRLIMVGSGPLPVTLMHIHQRTSIPRLTAVDRNPAALASIERLQRQLGWTRLEARCQEGIEVDFQQADAVYLANLISPKNRILARVAAQVAGGTPVIVREPAGIGALFAESSEHPIPPGLRKTGHGEGDHRFLSRHLFLVRDD